MAPKHTRASSRAAPAPAPPADDIVSVVHHSNPEKKISADFDFSETDDAPLGRAGDELDAELETELAHADDTASRHAPVTLSSKQRKSGGSLRKSRGSSRKRPAVVAESTTAAAKSPSRSKSSRAAKSTKVSETTAAISWGQVSKQAVLMMQLSAC